MTPAPLLLHTCPKSDSSSNNSFLLVRDTVVVVAACAAAAACGSCRLNCSNITIINIGQNGDVAMLLPALNNLACLLASRLPLSLFRFVVVRAVADVA